MMEGCRDRLVAAVSARDLTGARRLSSVLDALLHLDGEVRRHAEPRFLVEATLARLAVELGSSVPEPALEPVARAERVREPALEPVARAEVAEVVAVQPVGDISGWSAVLEKLNRTVRAAYLDAQPEVNGGTLVLWFRYGFHHKKAQEQSTHLLPLVRAWLGPDIKVEYRLKEANAESPPSSKPASPEDDPFVREVVRRFDGRVTRVKEISE